VFVAPVVGAGRGVFAARDIDAGALVLSADVLAVTVDVRHRHTVCHNCLALSSVEADSSGGEVPRFSLCCGPWRR